MAEGTGAGPWLTLPRLWLVVVLGAIGVMELAQVPSAVDLAYHLKVGELIVAERAVPRTDVLAWTTAHRTSAPMSGAPPLEVVADE